MKKREELHKQEEEQVKMWVNYLSMVFSQPSMDKPSAKYKKAKKDFEKSLMPNLNDSGQLPNKPNKRIYKWDFELEESEKLEQTERG